MTGTVTRARDVGLELARMLATLFWVSGASVVTVAVLGAVPGWIAGESAGVRRVTSVDDAERRLGARLLLPAFFPERIAWPAAEVRVAGGRRGSAALAFRDHAGAPALQLVQATDDAAPIADALLEGATVLDTRRTAVASRPATLSSVLVEGVRWSELRWSLGGRAVVLRGRGDLDELFAIARSIHGRAAP
ncbi:hypothetical protein [Anaeromyxobacter oryzae]|uniref:Transmembrane protein n=1 Tax=Anaeromyxobacter oryzae TaxID=2918170 RepID=A0ABN6N2W4_9BACT|nr:hypothetical protein [Anaeromyxobacter oryzae]BDG06865.1 hypothetical protein AMOR_58610 [Anaeromyxobacter oryzae]